jgi:hypothetical protein
MCLTEIIAAEVGICNDLAVVLTAGQLPAAWRAHQAASGGPAHRQ